MRYLYVLAALGEEIGRSMAEGGVPKDECEAWLLYWEQLLATIATTPPGGLSPVVKRFLGCVKVARFYSRQAGEKS